jgi:hypothetical protein
MPETTRPRPDPDPVPDDPASADADAEPTGRNEPTVPDVDMNNSEEPDEPST